MKLDDDTTYCKDDVVAKYKRDLLDRLPVIHFDRLPLPRDLNNQAIDLEILPEKLNELYIDLFGAEKKEIRKARESEALEIYNQVVGYQRKEPGLSGKMQLFSTPY